MRKPKSQQREPAEAICVASFRPAPVARLVEKGERLPIGDELVRAHPDFFLALLPIPKKVTDG